MKKTFFKNLFRDIRKTLSRFLSIVVIIAVGVSFYAGVRAASPDMKKSGDYYFQRNNLYDFELISTLGLTKGDIDAIKKFDSVKECEGSYSIDAVIERDERSLVVNVNSIPGENGINSIRMIRGRRPENDSEAIVEDRFLKSNKLKLGDKIVLESGNSSKISNSLKTAQFTIVGTADSPIYVSDDRQLSSVGNGSVKGFVYILPDVFKSDVYTEAYVTSNSSTSKDSLLNNEEYKKFADGFEQDLKIIGAERSEIRYADIMKTANDSINDAENKLNDSKKKAADKFAEGYKKLSNAQNRIDNWKKELENNEIEFGKQISGGQKQISDGLENLNKGQQELEYKKQGTAQTIASAISQRVADLKKQNDSDPTNQSYAAQYNALKTIYENDINGKNFDGIYNCLKRDGALDSLKSYFDIQSVKDSFDKAQSDIDSGKQQLSIRQDELNKAKQEGEGKLSKAKSDLAEGQKQVDENTKKLKAEEKKVSAKFNDAEAEIQKDRDKIDDIKKPDLYVLGRSENIGYETYRQDSDRINNIGKVFPLIFFLVAALVSLTTMTRMVEENRSQVGTLKALGYTRVAIAAHYLIYSLSASLLGSLIGLSLGFRIFPPLILNAYSSLYAIPDRAAPFNIQFSMEGCLLAVLFTSVSSAAATLEELREVPASLMRPKAPAPGKTILLEKITFLWNRLSFSRKVAARNIFRYKQRFLMTITGIAACTGLMIAGFALKGAIVGAVERQFNVINRYDLQATLTSSINSSEKSDLTGKIMKDTNIKSLLFSYTKNCSVKGGTSENQDAYIVVPENKDDFNDYINLTMREKSLKLNDDGAIITQKLSRIINKKAGDTAEVTINDKIVKVKIAAVTEQYIQHYIYMSPDYYQKVTGEKLKYNSFYGLLKDDSESCENNSSKILTGIKGINSISFKKDAHVSSNMGIKSLNLVVLLLIMSAGVLAFVVIYNLTNININERKRELATIKLLGFYNHELAFYIYRENIILTLIGSIAGIGLGILMNRFIISTAETGVLMFLRTINPVCFLYSILFTILFSVIVNLAMYSKFDRIDMIESLKSAE